MTMTIYWIALGVLGVIGFAGGETYALINKTTTLSQFVWNLNGAWPMAVAISGLVSGVLVYHFYGTARTMPASESLPQIVIYVVAVMVGGIATSFLWTKGG